MRYCKYLFLITKIKCKIALILLDHNKQYDCDN